MGVVQGLLVSITALSTEISQLESNVQTVDISIPLPHSHTAQILVNPIDIYRVYLANLVGPVTREASPQTIYGSIQWIDSLTHGGLVIVAPKFRLKGVKAAEVAMDLAAKVDLRLRKSLGYKDPSDPTPGQKKFIMEFSSPNIAKEFHTDHLRSTIIDAYLSKLYRSMGWDVVNMNNLRDSGKQFGLLVIGRQRFGFEEAFKSNPLSHLLEVYVTQTHISTAKKRLSMK
ncbi:MAG: hypothetical protein Q9164_001209 [Protoblastenia rupestris]